MISFKSHIQEAAFTGEGDGSHYTHTEDEIYLNGSKGIQKIMVSMIELVKGIPTTKAQTKIDGSPSCFYGKKDGKFFVATKSVFNADPKINFTNDDIDKNHGHAPGLVGKLKAALHYLPSIYNGGDNEIMQGDVMFTPEDVHIRVIDGTHFYTFKPNVVVNAVYVNSDLGKEVHAAKFGFAPHTKYTEAGRRVSITRSDIKKSNTVFEMPIDAPILSEYSVIQAGINKMRKTLETCSREGLLIVSSDEISPLIMQYANDVVKRDAKQTFKGFVDFINSKYAKEISKLKTAKAIGVRKEALQTLLDAIHDYPAEIASVIDAHETVAKLKDLIISELDKQQPIRRYFQHGSELVPTNPEGYVGLHDTLGTTKLVNRSVFSKQNFLQNAQRTVTEAAAKKIAVIVPLGRFNPPHKDHANLVDACIKYAAKVGGRPIVYVSLTQNSSKDPLTADEKIFYLDKMYPGKKGLFKKPPKANPSMIGVMQELNGLFDEIVVILGDDRMNVIPVLNKYNGKEYQFDKIKGMSRHEITNTRDTEGDGIHASDIRRWAKEDDFESVRDAMSPKLSDKDVHDIMKKIKDRTK